LLELILNKLTDLGFPVAAEQLEHPSAAAIARRLKAVPRRRPTRRRRPRGSRDPPVGSRGDRGGGTSAWAGLRPRSEHDPGRWATEARDACSILDRVASSLAMWLDAPHATSVGPRPGGRWRQRPGTSRAPALQRQAAEARA
jgi:hypothetical protein